MIRDDASRSKAVAVAVAVNDHAHVHVDDRRGVEARQSRDPAQRVVIVDVGVRVNGDGDVRR